MAPSFSTLYFVLSIPLKKLVNTLVNFIVCFLVLQKTTKHMNHFSYPGGTNNKVMVEKSSPQWLNGTERDTLSEDWLRSSSLAV